MSQLPCNACGITMERADSNEWNNSEDRECQFTDNKCEECCKCGGHN